MNQLTVSSVVLIILHSVLSTLANVKITPIAVENNKSNLKSSDLKVEEARYRDPIMPEYYGNSMGNSYDRNRQNFVTSSYGNSYGSGLSNYDRYGMNGGYDKYGSNYDRYGSQWNKDRNFGSTPLNPLNPIENKYNYMPGGTYNPQAGLGLGLGNNNAGGYGGRYPYEGGSMNGPYPTPATGFGAGIFPPDLEGKTSLILPLAGAALLGIAAYALVANPGFAMAGSMGAMGKRRKRSLFDEKLEQHLVYRAHQNKQKAKSVK